ncbi:MAG: hypothetical protein E7351_00040 [Clostridiales bacterium]|nr:hypothetical protein [Clostridiales bacterium]
MRNRNEITQGFMKVAKRIAITILCCIPVLIIFGYLTRNIITQDWVQIICFIIIMGVAVLIEELIVRNREKNKNDVEKKDVFK